MKNPLLEKNVIVIGAGASGYLCAIECAKRGRSVLILDHANRSCSKVLISGGGRCNFTNIHMSADHYVSENPHFCKSAIARFAPRDFMAFLERYRIEYYEKEEGQLFATKSSRDIVGMLEQESAQHGVQVRLSCKILNIEKNDTFVITGDDCSYRADSLVIATGGLSYAKLRASNFGYEVARRFGLDVTRLRPGLVPFIFAEKDRESFQELAGISLPAKVTCGGKTYHNNILFTHKGLSGPAALQASLHWTVNTPLSIDLLPLRNMRDIFEERRQSKIELQNLLAEYFPKRFVHVWLSDRFTSKPVNQTSDRELREIADAVHGWSFTPKGTEGYETAEVTAGGVNTRELSSKTMEAQKVPGLYFTGEVVDVTGELGGYNLHWAWASGFAAGQYA